MLKSLIELKSIIEAMPDSDFRSRLLALVRCIYPDAMESTIRYDEPVYQRRGRRYVEVGSMWAVDAKPHGCQLTVRIAGGHTHIYPIEPDRAEVAAAIAEAKDEIVSAIIEANRLEPRPQQRQITQRQRDLLDELQATGFDSAVWSRKGIYDCVDAGMHLLESRCAMPAMPAPDVHYCDAQDDGAEVWKWAYSPELARKIAARVGS